MKFSCDQQELVRALSVVSKAVTTRTTTQVMKGILIEAKEGGTLTMSASDLDISIQNTMQADVQEEGSVIAMAKLFVDIIRKLPHSEITIESDDDFNITIRSANSEFQVVGMSPDEFPERIKEQEGDKYIEFNRREFSSMIEKTAFAASIEEARGIITGVLLEIEPDGMNMVAIDGYRMAINKSAMVTGASGNVVIAAKMLGEIGKILADVGEDETGRLYLNEKKAVFLFDQTQAELKLMEGEFIRYKDIFKLEGKALTFPYLLYLTKENAERALLVVPYTDYGFMIAKGLYYCMTEPGSEYIDCKNEIVAVCSNDAASIAKVFSDMFVQRAGSLQRNLDSRYYRNYDELKEAALKASEALKAEALNVLGTMTEKTERIRQYVIDWFLLKKVLYVQYMVNKNILNTVHEGNVKKQRNQAKVNADEVTFLSYSEMWRLTDTPAEETEEPAEEEA